MSKLQFNLDNSGGAFTPTEPPGPVSGHKLRFENHSRVCAWEPGAMWSRRVLTGEATVTCTCGLDTGVVPSDEGRLAYERHRNLIHDEIAPGTSHDR